MGELASYRNHTEYNETTTQIDGELTCGDEVTQLDIWSTGEKDLLSSIIARAEAAWEKGEVLAQDYEDTISLIVPIAPLSVEAIRTALQRFRPEAASIELHLS